MPLVSNQITAEIPRGPFPLRLDCWLRNLERVAAWRLALSPLFSSPFVSIFCPASATPSSQYQTPGVTRKSTDPYSARYESRVPGMQVKYERSLKQPPSHFENASNGREVKVD
jgi:hypothetical protein